ncbi:response regulator transcription factor [Megasphaera butyrica]|uniref:response regulator transcription factor n=1 Tax=Megasphaera butyrica TaxID=2981791 RepID=UPI0008223E88|nr:response regulator transcription factor [Megasphaera butyrica]MCU6715023.1 response regulator transcription factor [Megasphaera butyrica]SCH88547.1 Staphylococcal respiratory response protein A [uncultured Megasphaera sp.]SCJ47897.1 Staphylococcal respiratory response protein A [uncultured Ruminococcus sp.]
MKRILIIEDNKEITELERDYLEANDFEVDIAGDGVTGLEKALADEYNLILLDIMLPRMDGFQVCREIRAQKDVPILMVSAKREDIDKIRGLGLGADDYISKPFSPSELVARVKAHISRYERLTSRAGAAPKDEDVLKVGELEIHLKKHRVFSQGKEAFLTNREFELLAFLAKHPGIVFSRERIFDRVWGLDAAGDTATVMVHINRIREKIEPDPTQPIYIETVWGAGYRFAEG